MKKKYKKKILLVGVKEKNSLEMMYYRAFKHLGLKVYIYVTEKNSNNIFIVRMKNILSFFYLFLIRKKFFNFIKKNSSEFDVIIIFKGIYFDKKTLINCKQFSKKAIWINIFPDDPFNPEIIKSSNYKLLETIKFYDFFCIWSKRILKKLKKIINSKNLIYLPFGYDNSIHYPSKKNLKRKLITFIGTLDIERAKFLNKLNNININVYGNNSYKYKKIVNNKNISFYPEVSGEKIRDLMKKSIVSINVLRNQNKNSHNMKTFEIPSMNCLMLTTKSREQNDFFPVKKACLMYSSVRQFNKQINYIINNYNKISKIRSVGYKISKKHTYINRATKLLNEISKFKN
jgi:hypothetical protein